MKRILALSVAMTAFTAMPSFAAPASVDVTLDVPASCTILSAPEDLDIGTVPVNQTTGVLEAGGKLASTTMSIACNVAGSSVALNASPLTAANPTTTNTRQFTNNIGYLASLVGGNEFEDGDGVELQATPTVGGVSGSDSGPYGRFIGQLTLSAEQFTSGSKAVVAGGYAGTITVTLNPDTGL